MYGGYSYQEVVVLLLSFPFLAMLFVTFINSDSINNSILKTSGTSKLDSFISNKESWKAGFKIFYTLLSLSVLAILFLYTRDSITEGEWFRNFFRYIFLIILSAGGIVIFIRTIYYLSK